DNTAFTQAFGACRANKVLRQSFYHFASHLAHILRHADCPQHDGWENQMPDRINNFTDNSHIVPVHLIAVATNRKESGLCRNENCQKGKKDVRNGKSEIRHKSRYSINPFITIDSGKYAEGNSNHPRKDESRPCE